jgi:pantoate--beta-alanine ligase
MEIVESAVSLRQHVDTWRSRRQLIGFVPTMGNLHAGHFALVTQARAVCDRVVVSVFVNPTQFGPGEDFERYPRTPQEDAEGLQRHGCDLMFLPDVTTLYPYGAERAFRLAVPEMADVLCGAHRPGHFDGVVTVVSRLFNLVRPDVAVFGEKDFQQLRILEQMTRDLGYAIKVERGETVREPDGLAMSSRNRYLDPAQRATAPRMHAAMLAAREGWRSGRRPADLEHEVAAVLGEAGFRIDYVSIRRASDLSSARDDDRDGLRIFVAARLGPTRLIDNMALGERP